MQEKNAVLNRLGKQRRESNRPPEKEDIEIKDEKQEAFLKEEERIYFLEQKEILVEFILDATYSFSAIYKAVYYAINQILMILRDKKMEYPGITIKYGLTLLHDHAEPINFDEGVYFTESEKEFLTMLQKIEFYGGSFTGREDLVSALDTGLRILNNYENKKAYRGLFMFSDSLPEEAGMKKDFLQESQNGYINKGLRFAVFYTYTDDFVPALKMVDADGNMVENGRNEANYCHISSLLSSDQENVINKVCSMVDNLLAQVSVRI